METEAKFALTGLTTLAQIDAVDLEPYGLARSTAHALRDTLIDTATGELANAKVALRIRQDGDTQLITWKGPATELAPGVHRRSEIELPLPGPTPLDPATWPTEIRERYRAVAGDQRPIAVCAIINQRQTWLVRAAGGHGAAQPPGPIAEIALDRAEFVVGAARRPFVELEVELKRGDEADLAAIIARLGRALPLTPQPSSKAERGRAFARAVAGQR